MQALPVDFDQIVVTASRISEEQEKSAASAAVIDPKKIERLGEPLVQVFLRLTPSVAVVTQGSAGLFTEVRIRGAENNHTLLFIDGIRANDPATGDFARFELLNADLVSRIEVVRGPQSALWGSQAIGGVIAINGVDNPPGHAASGETGSFGLLRGSASAAFASGRGNLAGAVGWLSADGIDTFSGDGDKDGWRNLSVRLRGTYGLTPSIELGGAAFALTGRAQFDGYDPVSFERADTLDNSRNRLAAGRLWAALGKDKAGLKARIGVSALGSSNRNFLDSDPVNTTKGSRLALDAQIEHGFTTGRLDHRFVLAVDAERETFRARDRMFGGFTNQDRSRSHRAATVEWRARAGRLTGDVALRRDMYNRFNDATSMRASVLAELGQGFALAGSYAEGIAQPTFFDLYGFFPNNFIGNPSLRPESSRGFEASARFRSSGFAATLTAYRQVLHDEIVDVFDFDTFQSTTENHPGKSRRSGIEAEIAWRPLSAIRATASYAYLKASQPDAAAGELAEVRRPEHSGSVAIDGAFGRWSYGASLAYAGMRLDREEVFPFGIVNLDSYWLAGARVAYAVSPAIAIYVRGSNLLNERYEDSAGYRTEGRGLFVGLRLADRRSSP